MDTLLKVAVIFALPEEEKPFLRLWRDANKRRGSVTITKSGVGAANAAQAAKHLTPKLCASMVVCGFGGGLSDTALPGNLIFADKVTDGTESFSPDAELLKTAETIRVPNVKIERGTLVTVDKVATTAAEKRDLATRTGAIAVDMETAGAVRVAQERGIPWLAVRAITDGANDELPLDFNALANPDGSVNRGRVIRATLAQPQKIPALIRLGQRSSLAANNLAAFLVAFLQTLPEGF